MRITVSTCDKYKHLLPGFAYLFNKYWHPDQAVTVLGFAPPDNELPPNFEFVSMAPTETQSWTDHHREWLEKQNDELILFLLDDYWLIAPVRLDAIKKLETEILEEPADKGDLNADMYGKHNQRINRMPLPHKPGYVKADPMAAYRSTTQPCIWRRDFLLELMIPGRTPWEFEIKGNDLTRDKLIIAPEGITRATRLYPMVNLYNKGKPDNRAIKNIPEEDMLMLKTMGYQKMLDAARIHKVI